MKVATATTRIPGAAIGSVLLAWVLMRRGEDRAAADLLSPAAPILERTGYSWGPLSLTLLAAALARSGAPAAMNDGRRPLRVSP